MKALVTVHFKPGVKLGSETYHKFVKGGRDRSWLASELTRQRLDDAKRAAAQLVTDRREAHEAAWVAAKKATGQLRGFIASASQDLAASQQESRESAEQEILAVATSEVFSYDWILRLINLAEGRIERLASQSEEEELSFKVASDIACMAAMRASTAVEEAEKAAMSVTVDSVTNDEMNDWIRGNVNDEAPWDYGCYYFIASDGRVILRDNNGTELVFGAEGFEEPRWWATCPESLRKQIDRIVVRVTWFAREGDSYQLGEFKRVSDDKHFPGLRGNLDYSRQESGGVYTLHFRCSTWDQVNAVTSAVRRGDFRHTNNWGPGRLL